MAASPEVQKALETYKAARKELKLAEQRSTKARVNMLSAMDGLLKAMRKK
ncbi:MAG: hypothetical protein ABWY25_07680 [Paenisporosarcina sp.]